MYIFIFTTIIPMKSIQRPLSSDGHGELGKTKDEFSIRDQLVILKKLITVPAKCRIQLDTLW